MRRFNDNDYLLECEECSDIIEKCDGCKKRLNIDDIVYCADADQRHLCEECLGFTEASVVQHED